LEKLKKVLPQEKVQFIEPVSFKETFKNAKDIKDILQ